MPAAAVKKAVRHPSLADYIRDQKRAGCKVCALPESVRAELREGRRTKAPRAWQIGWLKVLGHTITSQDMDSHNNGRHDVE